MADSEDRTEGGPGGGVGRPEDKIAEFCSITGATPELAESLLKACNGSLEMAINLHMEMGGADEANNEGASVATWKQPSGDGLQESVKSSPQPGPSREGGDQEEDEVRAPIPQKQETLVEAGYDGYALRSANPHRNRIKNVFDGFRNFGSEANSYSIADEGSTAASRGRKRTLEELFKPPLDVMFKGDWQAARDAAEGSKKWLLVNIQDAGEFPCQVLNRDVWSSEAVKTILKEHFIFWQQYKESENAQRYMTFYPVTSWPHVSILDPRTGEQLVTWPNIPDASTFCELATEFLTLNPSLEATNTKPPPYKKSRNVVKSIVDADEEDQLAAAIQASLAESAPSSSTTNCNQPHHTAYSESESEVEPFSGEDSNFSIPTPVKRRSKPNSRAESPDISNGNGESRGDTDDAWEIYLGDEESEKSRILIRFPDGKRESKHIPCTSQFKAISTFVKSQGFPLDRYEIVTNFPRRILTDLDETQTLKDLGLFPQETIFVQQRS